MGVTAILSPITSQNHEISPRAKFGSARRYSLNPESGLLLLEFPNVSDFACKEGIDKIKMQTFLMMYRTHSQRVFDTVISANFGDVRNFLIHFWKEMPTHLMEMLEIGMIADVIAWCDMIVYNALTDVLIPSTIQDMPQSLAVEIKAFADRFPDWLDEALVNVNGPLKNVKIKAMKTFILDLRRQMSFIHLAQAAIPVVTSDDHTRLMLGDLANVDFTAICQQAAFAHSERPNNLLISIHDR
ncbi:DNA-binding protein RFX6 [Lamellibrachia satsuma]|nr:DNA-binding protein RFX6 [Lamellibrachia satsuma]